MSAPDVELGGQGGELGQGDEQDGAAVTAAGAWRQDRTLFITLKTVENHLGNAYRKLGVAGRTELTGALDDRFQRGQRS